MKIADGLFLVGSGYAGFGLSGEIDANCYAVDTGDGIWLFDVGLDSGDRLLANLRSDGLDPDGVAAVFVTHHHADHAGALGFMAERLPAAAVAVGADVAAGVRSGDESANGLAWARRIGYYPDTFALAESRVDIELSDRATFDRGGFRLTAVATPGHCVGHFCFLVEGPGRSVLLSGDQVFCDGRIALQNLPDVSISAIASSMRTLQGLDFEALLPGHGRFTLDFGRRHVDGAAAVFDNIGLPPNLF